MVIECGDDDYKSHAMNNLGLYYDDIMDIENMLKYYNMAVDKNNINAMHNLYVYYSSIKDYDNMNKYKNMVEEIEN